MSCYSLFLVFFLEICVNFVCLVVILSESSSHRSKEDHKLSKVEVERRNFSDQLESSNPNKNSKPGYQTRYFIIKSLNYDNIQVSVEKGIWATQVMNEPILEGAFHVRISPC